MDVLFLAFIGGSALLWLSVYGYLFFLWVIASRKRHGFQNISEYPRIALVIPTLNEENLILSKLRDLENSDYPGNRMTILVVDGGSSDRTVELVEGEIAKGRGIRLVCIEKSRGKSDQVRKAFQLIEEDIAVFTDTDALLERSCIRELVGMLIREPGLAVVGACIRPDTVLLEERLHWGFLNYLWWLEGEALSAAGISGVCYACRLVKVMPAFGNAKAEDIHLALSAAARGYAVRICRQAYAVETRVPQTAGELLKFRRRRGGVYVSELLQSRRRHGAKVSTGYVLARFMRLWHFLVAPKIGVGLFFLGAALLLSGYRIWLMAILSVFIIPCLIILFSSDEASGTRFRWLRLGWAACRLFVLTSISMILLNIRPTGQGPVGGRT